MVGLTVILAAHGAGDGSPANERIVALAQRLEGTMVGARARSAFRRGTPSVAGALRDMGGGPCVVVPVLTSDGFHAHAIRDDVGATSPGASVAEVLGSSPEIEGGVIAEVTSALVERGIAVADCTVLVVGHGTPRDANSRRTTSAIARALATSVGVEARVGFIDDTPDIEAALGTAPPTAALVVLPWLLGGGPHALTDVPERVCRSARALGRWAQVVTLDPLADLAVLDSAVEGAIRRALGPRATVRVGARGSALSRRQVDLFAAALAPLGVDVAFEPIETPGDRDRITTAMPAGFFSDDIDVALADGRIDVALHSAKDAGEPGPGLVDAAYLARGAVHEVLVARDGATLGSLPAWARVGTSCERRARQVRRLRPDLRAVPIRGDVPSRVDAVDMGSCDAVVLAEAGLVRLGLERRISQRFDLTEVVPAPAQGAIVARCRASDPCAAVVAALDDAATRANVRAERDFAHALEARGVPVVAAVATPVGHQVVLFGRTIAADGRVTDVVSAGRDASTLAHHAVRRWANVTGAGA
ncbi:MAG: hydroxymethylbilane synthase [Gemmatimonadaceae bacterium]